MTVVQTGKVIRSRCKTKNKKWFKITGVGPSHDRLHLATVSSYGNACEVAMLFAEKYEDIEIS